MTTFTKIALVIFALAASTPTIRAEVLQKNCDLISNSAPTDNRTARLEIDTTRLSVKVSYVDAAGREAGGSEYRNNFQTGESNSKPSGGFFSDLGSLLQLKILNSADTVIAGADAISWSRTQNVKIMEAPYKITGTFRYDRNIEIYSEGIDAQPPNGRPGMKANRIYNCIKGTDKPPPAGLTCSSTGVSRAARIAFGKTYISPRFLDALKVREEDLADAYRLYDVLEGPIEGQKHSCVGTINLQKDWFETKGRSVDTSKLPLADRTGVVLMSAALGFHPEGLKMNYTFDGVNKSVAVQNPITLESWVLHCDQCGGF